MSNTKRMAQAKAERALALIEQAQNLLSQACSELSSVTYAMDQWELVGVESDRVKALWHQVNGSLERDLLDLDEDTKRRLMSGE